MEIYLKTKNPSGRSFQNQIPAGSVGRVIDIMIEDDGETSFLLEFEDINDGDCEWYSSTDIEPKY